MQKPKPLRERLTKAMLNDLYERKVTNRVAADIMGVSETHLSRVVASIQGKTPGVTTQVRQAARKITKTRIEVRRQLAKKVNKGRMTIAEAAKQADCSERTIFRYVAQYRQ